MARTLQRELRKMFSFYACFFSHSNFKSISVGSVPFKAKMCQTSCKMVTFSWHPLTQINLAHSFPNIYWGRRDQSCNAQVTYPSEAPCQITEYKVSSFKQQLHTAGHQEQNAARNTQDETESENVFQPYADMWDVTWKSDTSKGFSQKLLAEWPPTFSKRR